MRVAGAGGTFEDQATSSTASDGSICNVYIPMGLTAENVAERYGVTREAQDECAVISQQRALAAQESRLFDGEITACRSPAGIARARDDGPRPGTTMERWPISSRCSSRTAGSPPGNACPLNDGAAAVLVMSDARAPSSASSRSPGSSPRR